MHDSPVAEIGTVPFVLLLANSDGNRVTVHTTALSELLSEFLQHTMFLQSKNDIVGLKTVVLYYYCVRKESKSLLTFFSWSESIRNTEREMFIYISINSL